MNDDIKTQLDRIEAKLDIIMATMDSARDQIGVIAGQVMPAIEALEKSPIFKMLGGKR